MTNMIGSFLLAALIPLAVFLRHFVLEDYENSIPNGGVLLIIVGALSIFCLLCYEQIQQNTRTLEIAQLFLIAYGGMLAIIMASVYAIYVMCTSRRDLLQLQSETERLRSEKEMSAMTSASLEDLRCLRHDLKNQYSYINLLIAEKRFDELESYCNRLSDHIPSQLLIIDCGNDFFNVLLNMWINRAKHHGIDVESHLVIPPALPFSEDDLCTLIANLFENALEACEKKSSGPIRMDILPWRDYLSIVFSNPTNAVSLKRHGGGLMTTKSNLNLHGYGTRSVARIASHYNGIVDYSIQDGWFTAKVLLDMKQNSSDSASS